MKIVNGKKILEDRIQPKTSITVRELRKRNPWIKTDEQARKIISDVNSKPSSPLMAVVLADMGL